MSLPSIPNSGAKSFWSLSNTSPDSLFGKGLLLVGGSALAYWGLPVLERLMWTSVSIVGAALTFVAGIGALAAIGYMIIDGRLVKLFGYGYRLAVRGLLGFFITLDPIGIMKNHLEDVNKTIDLFSERIGELRGAIDKAKEDQATFQREYDDAMAMVGAAHRSDPTDPVIQTQSNIANRRTKSIEDLGKLIVLMETVLRVLERYFNKSKAFRDDLSDTIDFEGRRRTAMKSAASAFTAARSILAGNTIGAEFYDAALEATQRQVAEMVGEMKQWVWESQDMIRTFELQEAAAVEKALQRLEQQEQGSKVLEYRPGDAVAMVEEKAQVPVEQRTVRADVTKFLDT